MNVIHYIPYYGPKFQNEITDLIIKRSNCMYEWIHKKWKKALIRRKFNKGKLKQYSSYASDLILNFFFTLSDSSYHVAHIFDTQFNTTSALIMEKMKNHPVILDVGDLHYSLWKISLPLHGLTMKIIRKFLDPISINLHYKLVDHIISRGFYLKKIISNLYEIEWKKISVIYDPVDTEVNAPHPSFLREKLGIEDKIVIGYAAGNIRLYKLGDQILPRGAELLYSVEKLVNEGYKDIVCIILGKGPGMDLALSIGKRLGILGRHVFFPGFVEETLFREYINLFDIGYLESFNTLGYKAMIGSKMQYYMSYGKPTISGNNGERKILLEDAGILIDPCEPTLESFKKYVENLTEAIKLLLDDEKLRIALGKNARKKARMLFDCKIVAKKTYKVYKKVY